MSASAWVEEASHVGEYVIRVRFSDGVEGDVDLSELVSMDPRAIVAPLKDMHYFARFRVDLDTVVWDNGFDLAPEYLRSLLRGTSAA